LKYNTLIQSILVNNLLMIVKALVLLRFSEIIISNKNTFKNS